MSVTKELIKRLAASSIKDPTLQSFSSLVSAILSLHSLPSLSSQSTVLNCLSSVVRLYSSGVKPFQQSIMEWARKGLYSDHYQLVQVCNRIGNISKQPSLLRPIAMYLVSCFVLFLYVFMHS